MGYTYDQRSPIKPRRPTLFLSWGRGPDFTKSDAIQTRSEIAAMASYLLIQVASNSLIILYDPSHSASRQIPQLLHIRERQFQVPDFIRDPSPAAFMLACLAYAFAAAAFYTSHPNDQYQRRFLLLAIFVATILSFPTFHSLKSCLPPMSTAALVLSAITHRMFPALRTEAVEEEAGVQFNDNKAPCQEKYTETS